MTSIQVTHDAAQWDWPLQASDGVVQVLNTQSKFEVGLDCHFFVPSEIEVKVHDHDVVIHCHHEERTDTHGRVTREVNRTYHLPSDVDTNTVKSHLTSRGVLKITADKQR